MDKRRPDLRDELGYIAPPNRKLPPVPGSNYNTCDRIKRGTVISKHNKNFIIKLIKSISIFVSIFTIYRCKVFLPSLRNRYCHCNFITISFMNGQSHFEFLFISFSYSLLLFPFTLQIIYSGRSMRSNHSTWDPRRPLYEELKPPPVPRRHYHGSDDCYHPHPHPAGILWFFMILF